MQTQSAIIEKIIGLLCEFVIWLAFTIEKGLDWNMEFVNGFIQQISNMRWSDYLDILIVAGIIYMLLPMIRSTGAMRIAKVIFGVMIIAGLAMALQLYTVSWILNQLLGVGLIAIVVLFQPELRRMMDHLGSTVSLRRFLTPEKKQDCYLCTDLLTTEKHASGLYDTCVFEFGQTELRKALNHIQTEEQEHGDMIYKYMKANSMYS